VPVAVVPSSSSEGIRTRSSEKISAQMFASYGAASS
jgi:hypothetical protein